MTRAPEPVPFAQASGEGDLLLPRPPGLVRQFWSRHARLADWLLAALWGGVPLLAMGATARSYDDPTGALIGALLIVIGAAGIFLRRSRPLIALPMSWGALLVPLLTHDIVALGLPAFAVYSVAVYDSSRLSWAAAGAAEALSIGFTAPSIDGDGMTWAGVSLTAWAIELAAILTVAALFGITIGDRKRYVTALIDRAAQLTRERDQQAQLAAAAERARIAREMHDVVSHSLTVMVTLAEGSAATAGADAERAAAVMREVARTGRDALGDMRRMLGVLGGSADTAELAPQPGLAELPALVARFRSLGLPVILQSDGIARSDATVQLTVHRIVQEGLTNALRYAHGPTQVLVRVEHRPDAVEVAIVDDGLPGFPTPSVGAGRGLIGLTERLVPLGGTLDHGPEPGHGWHLTATVPLAPPTLRRNPA